MQLAFKGYHCDDFSCKYNAEAAVNFIPPYTCVRTTQLNAPMFNMRVQLQSKDLQLH